MIEVSTKEFKTVAGETFYLAKIPPTRGVKKLWVNSKLILRRAPFLPDLGEIAGFQLNPVSEKLEYYIIPRRNYKLIFIPYEDIKESLPKLADELNCDNITHFVISTKIYNSLIFSPDGNKLFIVGRRPKDLVHKTVVLLLGDAQCEKLTPNRYKTILDNHISFVIDYPKVFGSFKTKK